MAVSMNWESFKGSCRASSVVIEAWFRIGMILLWTLWLFMSLGGPLKRKSWGSFKGGLWWIYGRFRFDPYKDLVALSINWRSGRGVEGFFKRARGCNKAGFQLILVRTAWLFL